MCCCQCKPCDDQSTQIFCLLEETFASTFQLLKSDVSSKSYYHSFYLDQNKWFESPIYAIFLFLESWKIAKVSSVWQKLYFSPICQLAGWIWDEREGEGEVASSPRAVAAQAIRGAAKERRLENRNFHLKLVPRGSDLGVLTWHEENWSVRAEKAESIAWLSGSQSAG